MFVLCVVEGVAPLNFSLLISEIYENYTVILCYYQKRPAYLDLSCRHGVILTVLNHYSSSGWTVATILNLCRKK